MSLMNDLMNLTTKCKCEWIWWGLTLPVFLLFHGTVTALAVGQRRWSGRLGGGARGLRRVVLLVQKVSQFLIQSLYRSVCELQPGRPFPVRFAWLQGRCVLGLMGGALGLMGGALGLIGGALRLMGGALRLWLAAADRSLWSGRGKGWSSHHVRSLGLADGRLGAAAVSDRLLRDLRCFWAETSSETEAQWGSMGCQEPQPHRQPEGPRPTEQPQRGMPVAPMAVSAEVWLCCVHILCLRCRGALWVWRDTSNSVRWSFVSMFSRDVMILSTLWYHNAKLSWYYRGPWRYETIGLPGKKCSFSNIFKLLILNKKGI